MTAWAADPEGHCDWNRDGKIDEQDAAMPGCYLRLTANLDPYYRQFDLNRDGVVNVLDWTIMQAMLQGIDYFYGGQRLAAYVPPLTIALNGALAAAVVAGMGGILIEEARN